MTNFEMRAPDWLSVKDALERVLLSAGPLGEEVVPTHDALGRALARGVLARAHLPPWDNSAMDGYAARSQDLRGASRGAPVTLQVVGETRVVGYFSKVQNWNKSKRECELLDRHGGNYLVGDSETEVAGAVITADELEGDQS